MIATSLLGLGIVGLAVFFGFHVDRRLGESFRPRRRIRPSDLRPAVRTEPQRQATGS